MEDVTLEIVAQLRDEASQPVKTLTGLCDRLSASLDVMRSRLRLAGADMAAFAGSAAHMDAHAPGAAPGARELRSPGSAERGAPGNAGIDMSAVNEALNGFSTALAGGTDSVRTAAGLTGEGARMLAGQLDKSAAAAASAGSMVSGAAGSAASSLRGLGAAAGELRSRFAAFRLPAYTAHAAGGILATPHLGMVAEDGPEAIIPLSADKRGRGIALLKQAGRALGVREYAAGGVPAVAAAHGGGISMGGVNVNIELHSDAAPQQAIAASGAQIADDVARAIADGLEQALRNMA